MIVYLKKRVVEQIGFSICFPRHFSTASFYVCNLKILKNLSYLYEVFSRRKTTNDCCYRLTSSNVNTVKEMWSRWYHFQFNKFVKAWVRVEILYLDFRKTPSNQNIKSSKVAIFEICEIFSFISHTYGTIKPPRQAAIKLKC